VVSLAVANSPLALQWASHALQTNKLLVLMSVKAFGDSLEFASDELKDDDEVGELTCRKC
jgi:hypothetical protein